MKKSNTHPHRKIEVSNKDLIPTIMSCWHDILDKIEDLGIIAYNPSIKRLIGHWNPPLLATYFWT